MECVQCTEESRREQLRSFWQQVSNDDKRQFATGSVALVGSAVGWGVKGVLGGLVGMFLGGCAGGIVGLSRYKTEVATRTEAKLLEQRELPR